MTWEYEPSADRKHKRGWKEEKAGFVDEQGELVGKCSVSISVELARQLINHEDSIEYSPNRWSKNYPERIYVIHAKQLYRATPTTGGQSYHGFPEHPSRALKLPRELKERILQLARKLGCDPEVAKCLKGK